MTKWAATSHDPKSHIHVDDQVHNYWLNKPSNHPLSEFGFTKLFFTLCCWISSLKFRTLCFKFSHAPAVKMRCFFCAYKYSIFPGMKVDLKWRSEAFKIAASSPFDLVFLVFGTLAFVLATKQNFVELCVYSIILHREKDADSNAVFQLERNIFFKFSLCVWTATGYLKGKYNE